MRSPVSVSKSCGVHVHSSLQMESRSVLTVNTSSQLNETPLASIYYMRGWAELTILMTSCYTSILSLKMNSEQTIILSFKWLCSCRNSNTGDRLRATVIISCCWVKEGEEERVWRIEDCIRHNCKDNTWSHCHDQHQRCSLWGTEAGFYGSTRVS